MADIKAEYIDHMGDDLRVVNAARVSFAKQSSYETEVVSWGPEFHNREDAFDVSVRLSKADQRLITYLAKHGHWTPFSHPQITLRETVPIFVARQRFKHMVGFTYNEVSRRYVDDEPEFFRPASWRLKADNVKQGSSEETFGSSQEKVFDRRLLSVHQEATEVYKMLLADGVCPEQARMVLPQSMMTSYYVTGSLAAFARAYKQRSESHSQREIQDLAAQWDTIISPLFPASWAALVA